MTPERFDALVAALLDGSISDAERDELGIALESDLERVRLVTELLRLEPILKDALSQEPASGGFPRRVQDALASKDQTSTQQFTAAVLEKLQDAPPTPHAPPIPVRARWNRWLIGASSAAAILVIALALGGFFKGAQIAELDAAEARVFVLDGSREVPAARRVPLYRRQGVRCESGTARIVFPDGSFVTVPTNCEVQSIDDSYAGNRGPSVVLKSGELHANVQPQANGSAFRVVTPSAVIKVIGTRFSVSEGNSATRLDVHEGKVELKRAVDGEKVDVVAGYFAVAASNVDMTPAPLGKPALSAISYVGDEGNDTIVGAGIQNDGTVVLAANLDGNWEGRASVELPGSTRESKGTLIRLASNGRSVLSVVRVCAAINDLSLDAAGSIYLAAGSEGVIKLNAAASRIEWRASTDLPCVRVDSGIDGTVAALTGNGKEPGRIDLFSNAGRVVGSVKAPYTSNDVAIDSTNRLVFLAGSRPGNSERGETGGVAYLNAYHWDGSEAWRNYGFDPSIETNLRSHTSCERIAIGNDGKLYGAFLSIGGNSIFARDPKTFATEVPDSGNDLFSRTHATGHTYLTFVARFEPLRGDYLAGQFLLGRDASGKGTDISPVGGGIAADYAGRIYLAGKAAFGGPLSRDAWSSKEFSGHEGFFCVFDADLQHRASYSTFNRNAVGGSALHCVAVPRRKELQGAYALAGSISPDAGGVRTLNAIQNTQNKHTEGFFVISGFNGFSSVEGTE